MHTTVRREDGDYTSPMSTQPWFKAAFGPDYLRIYAHRSDTQAQAQVSAMQVCGLLPRAGRVLDIACGAGRHLHAMRRAGLDARGLDYSIDLLRVGDLRGLATRADMREIPFGTGMFDWACSLFTSFGYFENDSGDLAMFAGAARVLKAGGRLVLDHINPQVTLRGLQAQTVSESEGTKLVQRRHYDSSTRLLCKDIEFTQGGETRRWQERVRLYEPRELEGLLRQAGFAGLKRFGDLDGRPWDEAASPRQVMLASR